jgi:hypothetical protein
MITWLAEPGRRESKFKKKGIVSFIPPTEQLWRESQTPCRKQRRKYSRNLRFHSGGQMWEVLQRLIDRRRARLDLKVVKSIFGFKYRPRVKRLETPVCDLTVFHVHYGK